jgi:hypothetical protein
LEIIVRGNAEQFAVLGESISIFFPYISIKKDAPQLLSGCASPSFKEVCNADAMHRYTQINNKPAYGSQEAKYLAVPLLRRIRVHAVTAGNRTDYL